MKDNLTQLDALAYLVGSCSLSQVRHLQTTIEPYFQKDFIRLLPKEVRKRWFLKKIEQNRRFNFFSRLPCISWQWWNRRIWHGLLKFADTGEQLPRITSCGRRSARRKAFAISALQGWRFFYVLTRKYSLDFIAFLWKAHFPSVFFYWRFPFFFLQVGTGRKPSFWPWFYDWTHLLRSFTIQVNVAQTLTSKG